MESQYIDSTLLYDLFRGGAESLKCHADEVNDLNVFPIPDGDTGSNMLLTIEGAVGTAPKENETVGEYGRRAADAMLLAARGNSGVILSQIADGFAAGLNGTESANTETIADAFLKGTDHAYAAVAEPVEGTILTVVREASGYAGERSHTDVIEYLSDLYHRRNGCRIKRRQPVRPRRAAY